jgi:hypothetical protein
MTDNKAGSANNADNTGQAAAKTDSTASAKAAARKKQQQLKNQKATPPAKKKQPPTVVKSVFEGIATGSMKGEVIAQGNGNMAGQFRMFQKKLAGAAAEDKAYGLDSAIIDLVAKKRSDFVKPKPDPSIHSKLVPEKDSAGDLTGGNTIVCFNPFLKDQMEAEYNMDLKFQSSNWNQYGRHQEGYYRTAIGNIDSDVLTYCRMDKRMVTAEANTDLVLLLLILRSVCAQNHGAVKVDEEYHNLGSVHSAVGFKQKKNVSNSTFADQVLDRYESSIFTSGKFVFGQAVYDKVLSAYTKPMTFKEYMKLSDDEQIPIDNIVKERTVARLIVRNSSNNRARNELLETYSVTNNTCYPNTISEAMSLLATFKNATTNSNTNGNGNNSPDDEPVVSYHEVITPVDDTIFNEHVFEHEPITEGCDTPDTVYDAHVMAAVIAEATAEIEQEQFIGPSFDNQQDVNDAYEKNEPDIVCCAHVTNTTTASNNHTGYPNHDKDFELIIYHTAQRIKNKSDVYTITYDPDRPSLISYNYRSQTKESIIDYSDAMRNKFKNAGIHDSTDLMMLFEGRDDTDAATEIKLRCNNVDQQGIHKSTVNVLREETIRNIAHANFNVIRYNQMLVEIGYDDEMDTFQPDSMLLHHVVSAVAIMQHRRRPNRWVNKITHKLISAGVTSTQILESKLNDGTLNDHLGRLHLPRLHHVTIHGLGVIIGTTDFRQGRS